MEKGSYKYKLRTAEFICTAICRAVQGPAPIQTSFHVLLVARGNRLRLVLTVGTRSSALRTKPESLTGGTSSRCLAGKPRPKFEHCYKTRAQFLGCTLLGRELFQLLSHKPSHHVLAHGLDVIALSSLPQSLFF